MGWGGVGWAGVVRDGGGRDGVGGGGVGCTLLCIMRMGILGRRVHPARAHCIVVGLLVGVAIVSLLNGAWDDSLMGRCMGGCDVDGVGDGDAGWGCGIGDGDAGMRDGDWDGGMGKGMDAACGPNVCLNACPNLPRLTRSSHTAPTRLSHCLANVSEQYSVRMTRSPW